MGLLRALWNSRRIADTSSIQECPGRWSWSWHGSGAGHGAAAVSLGVQTHAPLHVVHAQHALHRQLTYSYTYTHMLHYMCYMLNMRYTGNLLTYSYTYTHMLNMHCITPARRCLTLTLKLSLNTYNTNTYIPSLTSCSAHATQHAINSQLVDI